MSEISRATLFGKLNSLAYKAIEGATVFCKLRGNPYVELVHWIQQILQTTDSDLHRIVRHFELDPSRLAKDLTDALDRLPRGATSISDLSSHVESAVERGWVYASLMFGESQVRTGHLLVGIMKTPSLRNALVAMSRQFEGIKADALTEDFARIVAGSPEERLSAADRAGAPGEASDAMAPAQMGRQEALRRFATDLTERARKGQIDPVTGRDEEIRQIVDILMRRRQNNPILTGEAGVGKTAVVEGFARRLVEGDVPPPLKDVSLYTLDIGLLQAGASDRESVRFPVPAFLVETATDTWAEGTPIRWLVLPVALVLAAAGCGSDDALAQRQADVPQQRNLSRASGCHGSHTRNGVVRHEKQGRNRAAECERNLLMHPDEGGHHDPASQHLVEPRVVPGDPPLLAISIAAAWRRWPIRRSR